MKDYQSILERASAVVALGEDGAAFRVNVAGELLFVILSHGGGWEHASVTLYGRERCPTWDEMTAVRDIVWGPDEAVVQFHPTRKEHVNCHPYCLHLWRPTDGIFPQPPRWMVGPDPDPRPPQTPPGVSAFAARSGRRRGRASR